MRGLTAAAADPMRLTRGLKNKATAAAELLTLPGKPVEQLKPGQVWLLLNPTRQVMLELVHFLNQCEPSNETLEVLVLQDKPDFVGLSYQDWCHTLPVLPGVSEETSCYRARYGTTTAPRVLRENLPVPTTANFVLHRLSSQKGAWADKGMLSWLPATPVWRHCVGR